MIAIREIKKIPIWAWVNALVAAGSVSLYVAMANQTQAVGFPLDDAWIHQTYARNLADLGEWSFIPGVPSAGSTSPIWTFILSLFHLVSDQVPYLLTFMMGTICLWVLSSLGELIFRRTTRYSGALPLAGLFLAMEWHLVWAGASGMETALMAVIILAVFYFILPGTSKGYILAGLLTGIGVWIRPDALTLVGPLLFCIYVSHSEWKERVKIGSWSLFAGLIPFGAYLLFNFFLSGQIWPNTFYAKQAEYAAMQETSVFLRYANLIVLPLVGVGSLVLPGFIYKLVKSIRNKDWFWISATLWWLGYNMIYAVKLPVTYQHGRYLIPAMPVFFLMGLIGAAEWMTLKKSQGRLIWVFKKGWMVSLVVVSVAFLGLGASSYARDVAIINTEMVETAKWLKANTSEDDLIAVHDIGAVGYFSQRNIIDLAGLVTPEVIPIIRDEDSLTQLLDTEGVAYLMTFPGWYSSLADGKPIIYQSAASFSPRSGGENMAVYRWDQE